MWGLTFKAFLGHAYFFLFPHRNTSSCVSTGTRVQRGLGFRDFSFSVYGDKAVGPPLPTVVKRKGIARKEWELDEMPGWGLHCSTWRV